MLRFTALIEWSSTAAADALGYQLPNRSPAPGRLDLQPSVQGVVELDRGFHYGNIPI
jgi:hypothetical protein